MALDKTKIFSIAVDIFIAPAGTATGSPGSWTNAGWCENNQSKITLNERKTIQLHDGSDFLINAKYLFEAMALQTDETHLTALEAFMDQDIDILLINRNDRTTGYLIEDFTLIVGPEFNFNAEVPRKIKLDASRAARKLTDCYSELTGLSGY
jgi:hypothetical protein